MALPATHSSTVAASSKVPLVFGQGACEYVEPGPRPVDALVTEVLAKLGMALKDAKGRIVTPPDVTILLVRPDQAEALSSDDVPDNVKSVLRKECKLPWLGAVDPTDKVIWVELLPHGSRGGAGGASGGSFSFSPTCEYVGGGGWGGVGSHECSRDARAQNHGPPMSKVSRGFSPVSGIAAYPRETFRALLRQVVAPIDEKFVNAIFSSGWLASRARFAETPEQAASIYDDARNMPLTETRGHVFRERGIYIDGNLPVAGPQTALFLRAFDSNYNALVLKVPREQS